MVDIPDHCRHLLEYVSISACLLHFLMFNPPMKFSVLSAAICDVLSLNALIWIHS